MTKWKFLQINSGQLQLGQNTRFHLLETADELGRSNGWLLKWNDGKRWWSGLAVSKLAAYVLHRAGETGSNDIVKQLVERGYVRWVTEDTGAWM